MKRISSSFFRKVIVFSRGLCSDLNAIGEKFMATIIGTERKSIAQVYVGIKAVVILSLSGCYEYEDVYLTASRAFMHENLKLVSFRNSTTSEVITLHASDVVCHESGYSEAWQSYHHYKRFHQEMCSQSLLASESSKSLLDHSVVSAIWARQSWQYWFENSKFELILSGEIPGSMGAIHDSLQIGEQIYYDVFVLNNLIESTQEPHLDSLYLGMHDGVIKIVDSNNHSWIAL